MDPVKISCDVGAVKATYKKINTKIVGVLTSSALLMGAGGYALYQGMSLGDNSSADNYLLGGVLGLNIGLGVLMGGVPYLRGKKNNVREQEKVTTTFDLDNLLMFRQVSDDVPLRTSYDAITGISTKITYRGTDVDDALFNAGDLELTLGTVVDDGCITKIKEDVVVLPFVNFNDGVVCRLKEVKLDSSDLYTFLRNK